MYAISRTDYCVAPMDLMDSTVPPERTISHPNSETSEQNTRLWARAIFPAAYQIFAKQHLKFIDIDKSKWVGEQSHMQHMRHMSKLLHVGWYEKAGHGRYAAYASIHIHLPVGHKLGRGWRGLVTYVYADVHTNAYLPIGNERAISYFSPFCDAVEGKQSYHIVCPLIYALIHYYFLAAGHIEWTSICEDGSTTVAEPYLYKWFKERLGKICRNIQMNAVRTDGIAVGETEETAPTHRGDNETPWSEQTPSASNSENVPRRSLRLRQGM